MQRNVLIGVLVLVAVAGGLFWLAGSRSGLVSGPAVSLPAKGPFLEKTAHYEITANYPTSTPLTSAANGSAMALMRSFVATTISQFKTELGTANGSRPGTLELVYLIGSSSRTISYIYTINEDTGGAHGMTYFKTFVFDTESGAHLSLSDLFTPGTDYLAELSQASRARLPEVIGAYADAQMIENGTKPEEQNFENFFIDNHNIDFLFPPYQVAAYAQGPVTLQIPTSALSGLKSEYK